MTETLLKSVSRAARVQIVRAPCGVTAWLTEDYSAPLIALEFGFHGGSAQDPREKAGLATFLAGMLDEGAGPHDSAAFQEQLDDNAVHLSFSAARDSLNGHFQTLARNADPAFELLRLALCEPRFDPEPIERVRGQMIAGVKREANDPDSMAMRAFRTAAYGDHPYGMAPRGDLETLTRIQREDLVGARAAMMARANLKIAAVGAINAAQLAERLEALFGALPAEPNLKVIPDTVIANVGGCVVKNVDTPQSSIRFGRPGLQRNDPDFMAGMVVNHILGGGAFTARLFKEVREKRGLAYSVYSQMQNLDHAALLAGGTSTKNERAAESIAVIKEQIADLGANGPSEIELEKAKKYLIGSYALQFDTSTKIAGQLLFLQMEGLSRDYLDARNAMIAAVTMADAKRAAQRLFGAGELLVAVAGKPEGLTATL
jgi:zinc protease